LKALIGRLDVVAEELFEIVVVISILVASNLLVDVFFGLAVIMFGWNWCFAEAFSTSISRSEGSGLAHLFTTSISVLLVVGEGHVKA